jgi:hypothetical protein
LDTEWKESKFIEGMVEDEDTPDNEFFIEMVVLF